MGWQVLPEYPTGTIGNSCIVCHSDLRNIGNTSAHERALTTGVSIDFEGIVVVCESCIVEAAGLLGMVPEGTVKRLRNNNRELGRANARLENEVEQAKNTIRGLRNIFDA